MDDESYPSSTLTGSFQLTAINCTPANAWLLPSNSVSLAFNELATVTINSDNIPTGCTYKLNWMDDDAPASVTFVEGEDSFTI